MTMLMAIAHLAGAVLAVAILGFLLLFATYWWAAKTEARAEEELSIAFGVTVEKLKTKEMIPQVLKIQGERFSSELLRNRLSDLFGWMWTGWIWLGLLVTVGVLLAVAWNTFTDSLEEAIYAWVTIPIGFVFWVTTIAFAMVCRLITGRYPGQARRARKELANYIKTHKAASDL